ncbi:recombinase family protein, partial [Salipiger thiooxidans]|uniref:recombinase family protein n=1 Tax=Salipiger thiooxidans TaxID=282683 RepID=UPI001CD1A48C
MPTPLRAVIYARYSTDLQRDASIEDQVRACRTLATRQGYDVSEIYTDRATSGASLMRPGIQSLLHDARQTRAFDVVLAHALDRLSRSQSDIASIYQQLQFARIPIETVTEGTIEEMHIGLKGTMNALFLKDLAKKTREGLRGRALAGKSAGGLTYGYRAVRAFDAEGERIRGDREIHPEEAAVVVRVLEAYAAGRSPKKIAEQLNAEGVPGPRGGAWGASTIHGNRLRGTGILNNELYVGKQVWNRLSYVKDPMTGKRVSRMNPEDEWEVTEIPKLRIVDDDLWQAVRSRQGALVSAGTSVPVWDRRRPKFLFSRLMMCGCCGCGFAKVNQEAFGCSQARNKGRAICTNMATIKRVDLESRVLTALQHHLMDPSLVEEFCLEYAAERNRLQAASLAGRGALERELARVKSDHGKLVDAIVAGVPAEQVKDRMIALDERRKTLEAELANTGAPSPLRYHPGMAVTYRERVAALIRGLGDVDGMEAAKDALRGLVERIVLTPDADGGLSIDLHGALAALLKLAAAGAASSQTATTTTLRGPDCQDPDNNNNNNKLVLVAG